MGGVYSSFVGWFSGKPKEDNDTVKEIKAREKAEKEAAAAKKRAEEAEKKLEEARKEAEETRSREKEWRGKEAKARQEAEEAKVKLREAHARFGKVQSGACAKEKEAEAKHFAEESEQAALYLTECLEVTNDWVLETRNYEVEAQMLADNAQNKWKEAQKCLEFHSAPRLIGGIQPEVWPTEEEFHSAKTRIQYDSEKIHFAVCGSAGSGKSSLINAFRGLKNNNVRAAPTGVGETTLAITRYPDPRKEIPYNRLVWCDCPGAGTLKIPGWQYFNQQGLFIFDVIILVYDTRFTEIDVSIIENCERFNIPLFIVRSKADTHIQNIMKDLGYDSADDDTDGYSVDYEARARQTLIETTKNNVEINLEEAGLATRDIFIVDSSVIYSLVTDKWNKKKSRTVIHEARLIESVLMAAHERRYVAPAADNSLALIIY